MFRQQMREMTFHISNKMERTIIRLAYKFVNEKFNKQNVKLNEENSEKRRFKFVNNQVKWSAVLQSNIYMDQTVKRTSWPLAISTIMIVMAR